MQPTAAVENALGKAVIEAINLIRIWQNGEINHQKPDPVFV